MNSSSIVKRRVAVFGGAFDPPHQAHIFAVTTLLMRDDVSEVWLLPTYQHVFDKQMTDYDLRCEWLETCVQSANWSERVSICKIERDLGGQSRTYDTLAELESRHADLQFCFVIGADNLSLSHKWYRFSDLVNRWPVIVFGRPGFEDVLTEHRSATWCLQEVCLPPVSSTSVRDGMRLDATQSLRQVPPPIRASVRNHFERQLEAAVTDEQRVYILGLGRVGSSLEQSLRLAGLSVLGWSRRSVPLEEWLTVNAPRSGDVFVLTVPDQHIKSLGEQLSSVLDSSHVVLHCAGMMAPVQIDAIPASQTGVMHPIRSIASKDSTLEKTYWGVFGGAIARASIEMILDALSSYALPIQSDQHHLYHAAMVTMGNFPVALLSSAEEMMTEICPESPQMRQALLALMGSVFENLKSTDTRHALTGPVARRDLHTVQCHVDRLNALSPHLANWYRLTSLRLAELTEWTQGIEVLRKPICND